MSADEAIAWTKAASHDELTRAFKLMMQSLDTETLREGLSAWITGMSNEEAIDKIRQAQTQASAGEEVAESKSNHTLDGHKKSGARSNHSGTTDPDINPHSRLLEPTTSFKNHYKHDEETRARTVSQYNPNGTTEIEISSTSRLLAPTKSMVNRLKAESAPVPAKPRYDGPLHTTQVDISASSRLLAPTKATENRLKETHDSLEKLTVKRQGGKLKENR